MELKAKYFFLAEKYITNPAEKLAHWKEIEDSYSSGSRYYHTLAHLQHMFSELQDAWKNIPDPEILSWAVFYHDLIYDVTRNDNEERSADSAFALLMSYGMPKKKCLAVNNMILATKTHDATDDTDTTYFLDADLSILGADEPTYSKYAENVRKEFKNIPDAIFYAGRKHLLDRFLKRESIYKTEYFHQRLEKKARKNIESEINSLSVRN